MWWFSKKKKAPENLTEKQILLDKMKKLLAFLEEKEKELWAEHASFLSEAKTAKDQGDIITAKKKTEYAKYAELRETAANWAKKCIDCLINCIDEYSIVLPVRAGSNAELYHNRVKDTVEELTAVMKRNFFYNFYDIQEKIYPLIERLALEISDCAKI